MSGIFSVRQNISQYHRLASEPYVVRICLCTSSTTDGRVVADNLLEVNKVAVDYKGTPSVVFTTIPPLASVGLSEENARKMGLEFKANHSSTSQWYSSSRINESYSGFKVLIEEGTDKILGAHLLGPHADEVINIFAMAIRLELRASDLKKALWSYPINTWGIKYML